MARKYTSIPVANLHGNAGTMGPGEREQRYHPYVEKQKQALLHTNGCE